MLKMLRRILILFLALWLPLPGHAAVLEALCPPSAQASAIGMDTATAHAGEQRSEAHRVCETAPALSDGAGAADPDQATGNCFQVCAGCAFVPAPMVSPPDAPSTGANVPVLFQPPHVIDVPQRPPRAALS